MTATAARPITSADSQAFDQPPDGPAYSQAGVGAGRPTFVRLALLVRAWWPTLSYTLFAALCNQGSGIALAVVGSASVHGKQALRDYWNSALGRITSLVFSVDRILWDAESRELAIVYTAEINGNSRRVSENLKFDASGFVVSAEVFHGVPA